jgi:uncharacterized membrane protein YdjX (TVP38/TMEM64 family)
VGKLVVWHHGDAGWGDRHSTVGVGQAGAVMSATARRRIQIGGVVIVWAAIVVSWVLYQRGSGRSTTGTAQHFIDTSRGAWWAFLAYFLVSLIRPLIFVPATIVTVAAGMLFGPVFGIMIAVLAANASAMVGYAIGRGIGPSRRGASAATSENQAATRLGNWTARLRSNSFEAVLIMRLVFLPYDLVNYGCGFLKVKPWPFLTATAIGSLPATAGFVLIGGSISRIDGGFRGISKPTLALSVLLIVASIAASRVIRRRNPAASPEPLTP